MIWQIFCIIETAKKSVGKTCSCCVLLHNQSFSVKLKKEVLQQLFFSICFQARLLFQGEIEKWTVNLRKYAWKLQTRFISKPNGETGQGSGYYFDGTAEILVESPLGQVFLTRPVMKSRTPSHKIHLLVLCLCCLNVPPWISPSGALVFWGGLTTSCFRSSK